MKGTKLRLLLIVALTGLIAVAYFAYSRFSAKTEKTGQSGVSAVEEASSSQVEKDEDYKTAEDMIEKWYQLSDKNDKKGLEKLLSKRWFEPQNKPTLDKVMSIWTFSTDEQERGYRGVTLKYKIRSVRKTESVYGKILTVRAEDRFELWDVMGHHIREGLTIFVLATEGEKEVYKIRDLQWKILKDTSM